MIKKWRDHDGYLPDGRTGYDGGWAGKTCRCGSEYMQLTGKGKALKRKGKVSKRPRPFWGLVVLGFSGNPAGEGDNHEQHPD
jgi:hypothetical protein